MALENGLLCPCTCSSTWWMRMCPGFCSINVTLAGARNDVVQAVYALIMSVCVLSHKHNKRSHLNVASSGSKEANSCLTCHCRGWPTCHWRPLSTCHRHGWLTCHWCRVVSRHSLTKPYHRYKCATHAHSFARSLRQMITSAPSPKQVAPSITHQANNATVCRY